MAQSTEKKKSPPLQVPGTALLLLASATNFKAALADAVQVDYSCAHASSWFLNTDNDIDSSYNVKTEILTSALDSADWKVTTNRIPKYDHVMTAADMSFLNTRPNAATDYTTGAPTVSEGDSVLFGQDIGYAFNGQGCDMGMFSLPYFLCNIDSISIISNPNPNSDSDLFYLSLLTLLTLPRLLAPWTNVSHQ